MLVSVNFKTQWNGYTMVDTTAKLTATISGLAFTANGTWTITAANSKACLTAASFPAGFTYSAVNVDFKAMFGLIGEQLSAPLTDGEEKIENALADASDKIGDAINAGLAKAVGLCYTYRQSPKSRSPLSRSPLTRSPLQPQRSPRTPSG